MHAEVTLASHFLWVAVLHTLQKEPTLSTFWRHTLHCRFFLKVFSLKIWGSPFPAFVSLILPLSLLSTLLLFTDVFLTTGTGCTSCSPHQSELRTQPI